MQAIGRPPQRAPDGAPVHYERHRPEQTTVYRLAQQHAASFIAHTKASTGFDLPRLVKDEFDAFLECSILDHGLPRVRCGDCGHDKPLAFRLQAPWVLPAVRRSPGVAERRAKALDQRDSAAGAFVGLAPSRRTPLAGRSMPDLAGAAQVGLILNRAR